MADTPLEPGGGTSCTLSTSLSPPTRRRQPTPFCHSPWRSGRPPGLSWRADRAHMAGNLLPAWASTHWGPHSWLTASCSRQPGLWPAVWAVPCVPRRAGDHFTVTAWLLGLPAPSWPTPMTPGPRRVEPPIKDPGRRDSGQVISDGTPMAVQTVNRAKIFHVERLLGSPPMS